MELSMNLHSVLLLVWCVSGVTTGEASPLPPAVPVALFAQGVGALVQPGGVEALAQQAARPAAVQADEADANQPAAAQGAAAPEPTSKASPFEIRYIIVYVLMLIFVGGSTFLIIRPSGRKIQGADAAPQGKGPAKAKK